MYIPAKYQNTSTDEVWDFIRSHPFGLLVTFDGQKPHAVHIPMLTSKEDDQFFLLGHISRANPIKEQLQDKSEKLAIFQGPHAYVSSSWYEIEEVPTWNYIAVHCYGTTDIIEGDALYQELDRLVTYFETGQTNPFRLQDMDLKKIKREMRGIVGFKMTITKTEAAFKLSQNRSDTDHAHIINKLSQESDTAALDVAKAMKKNRP